MNTLSKEELWTVGRDIVLGAPQLYVDVDVEADGIAGYGSMLSIGAQSPTGENYYSEIRPEGNNFLEGHRQFCEEHGLQYERLMDEAPESAVVMNELKNWLYDLTETYGKQPVFTAYNAAYDWAHVDLSFLRAGIIDNPFGIAPFDLKSLAMPLSGQWDFIKTKKSQLPPEIVPDGDFTHNALEDAQYQQKLHFGMAALLGAVKYSSTL